MDWHWWGKVNAKGFGALVILPGSAEARSRSINVPWVREDCPLMAFSLYTSRKMTAGGRRQ